MRLGSRLLGYGLKPYTLKRFSFGGSRTCEQGRHGNHNTTRRNGESHIHRRS